MKQVNIALLGLGTVGQGVLEILEKNYDQLRTTMNVELIIKYIFVRDINKFRPVDVSKYYVTNDINDILNDDSIDIVLEVMGGIHQTVEYLKHLLAAGKHIVTANKDLLAEHLEELESLAASSHVSLKYEASVAGGIPIVNAINNGLNANSIHHFMGIFNGTSNFILSKMTHEQLSFEQALQMAADLGYAEQDPTADVDGNDAQRKVIITSYLAFNQFIKRDDVKCSGIRNVTSEDITVAQKLGYRIKLLGQASFDGRQVNAQVKPACLPVTHQLAHVENEYNAIYIDGSAVGDTMFYGRGAGSLATGSAVVSDLLYIISHIDTTLHTLPPHFELYEHEVNDDKYNIVLIADSPVVDLDFEMSTHHHDLYGYVIKDLNASQYEQLKNQQLTKNFKIYEIEGA